jgi:hypothetical protein
MKKLLFVGIVLSFMAQNVHGGESAEVTQDGIQKVFKETKTFSALQQQKELMSALVTSQQKENIGKKNYLLNTINIYYQGAAKQLYQDQFNALSEVEVMVYNAWLTRQKPFLCVVSTPAKKLPRNQGVQRATNVTDYNCVFKGFKYLKKVSKSDMQKAQNYVTDFNTKLQLKLINQSLAHGEALGVKCRASKSNRALGIMLNIGCLKKGLMPVINGN